DPVLSIAQGSERIRALPLEAHFRRQGSDAEDRCAQARRPRLRGQTEINPLLACRQRRLSVSVSLVRSQIARFRRQRGWAFSFRPRLRTGRACLLFLSLAPLVVVRPTATVA